MINNQCADFQLAEPLITSIGHPDPNNEQRTTNNDYQYANDRLAN